MTEALERSDRLARRRALDPTRSFIVQAPAGSGKTELLIQRFLTLLSRVDAPEEVVAITFTRKAAGEMRKRVLDALAAASAGKTPETEQESITLALAQSALQADEARGWGVVDNPARLRILSIDALCLSLAAQMPLLSQMGAVPSPVDDGQELYREAARETLAQLETTQWTQQVAALLWPLDTDSAVAQELLARLLARRDQWLRHGLACDREALTRAFVNLSIERLQQVRDLMPASWARTLLECAGYAAANLASSNPQSPILACRDLIALPAAHPDELVRWRGLAHLLLKKQRAARRRVNLSVGFPPPSETGISPQLALKRAEAKQRMESLLSAFSAEAGLPEAMAFTSA